MPCFLLLATRGRGEGGARAELSRRTVALVEWVARGVAAGVIRSGARIEERALRVTHRDGVTTATAISPDAYGSYFVIEAENFDSALAIASASPLASIASVVVLQLDREAALGDAASAHVG